MAGQSLELFFVDGKPDGMLTAEIFNWTGHVLIAPRTNLAEALKRNEAAYTGVYVLLGEDSETSLTRAYIGEADDVAERIRTHDAKKDWWTSVVIVTSSANGLNKAHARYLESRLIQQAASVAVLRLDNKTAPNTPSLSEAARANMEQFLEYLHVILPAVRVDGFLDRRRRGTISPRSQQQELLPQFELRLESGEVQGLAALKDGEFIVLAGSKGRGKWIGVEHNYSKLFSEIVESGVYNGDEHTRSFSSDYAFPSPSAAGAVLTGRSTAGPRVWKVVGTGQAYKEWEAERL